MFDPENTDVEHSKAVLKNVQKQIADTGLSLADLLDKTDLNETEYVKALKAQQYCCTQV